MCRRERELRGLIHDRFIVESDAVRLTCVELRLKERLDFEWRADIGVDDGDDKTVTILNRLLTWSNQLEVEADPNESGRVRYLHCPVL